MKDRPGETNYAANSAQEDGAYGRGQTATALDFEQEDISVRWNNTESHVGLLIKGRLWAVCEAETGICFIGRYRAGDNSSIPQAIVESFKPKH